MAQQKNKTDADVATTSLNYDAMAPHWELPHALMGGTMAMVDAGQKYLPKEPKEQTKSYNNRLNRSVLFGGYSKTVNALSGKPFDKPVGLKAPKELEAMTSDVDLTGRNLTNFARDELRDAINDGLCYILVDHPQVDRAQTRTLDDYRNAGYRPYFVQVDASSVIEATAAREGGKEVWQRVRIKETTIEKEPDNPNAEVEVERIRVLTPGRWELHRQNEQGKWVIETSGDTNIPVVPLVPIYTKRTGMGTAQPPLEDLAYLNRAHWQSASDQQNILHVARVPILFGAGFPDTATFEVGANVVVTAKDPNARLSYVEHSGQAIGAGQQDLENLEIRMAAMGYEPLVGRPAVQQTATQVVADKGDQISDLQAWTRNLEQGLEEAFRLAAMYMGLDLPEGQPDIVIDVDWDLIARAASNVEVLLRARAAGDISRETYWAELVRLGYLPESFDPIEELARLAREGPSMAEWTNLNNGANGGTAA